MQLFLLSVDVLIRAFLLRHDDEVVGSVRIDCDLAELASGDSVLEEDIELTVCETCN